MMMTTMMKLVSGMMGLALLIPASTVAQSSEESAAVERAALDYLEGFYEGSTEKIRRGVHPDVVKFGFAMQDGSYGGSPMSFDEMLAYATNVKESGRQRDENTVKRVEILDILDQTAAVKVYAWWGSDYLHMAKYEGDWKIVQVLWQTPPTD
jgi:hypothetical protein